MPRDLTLANFLKEFGMRVGAGAVVLGIFVGLGYVKRRNLLGLSSVLESQSGFFTAAFLLVGAVSVGWIGLQRYNS